MKVPLSAIFRNGPIWNIFVVESGKARQRAIEIGHKSQYEAEILNGLSEGETIILYPTSQLKDGVLVK